MKKQPLVIVELRKTHDGKSGEFPRKSEWVGKFSDGTGVRITFSDAILTIYQTLADGVENELHWDMPDNAKPVSIGGFIVASPSASILSEAEVMKSAKKLKITWPDGFGSN